jgi:hypothetical protein
MHTIYERIALALGNLSRKYLCDEDPEERRLQLREDSLKEVDAKLLPILQMRLVMQAWECDLKKDRERQAA